MQKWLTSLGYTIIIAVVIILPLPLLFGFFAERKCKQMAEIINTTTPLAVKIISYDRGWFSSSATTQISLNNLEIPNKELYQLTINANITHGPVLIDWVKFYFVQAMVDATINLNDAQNKWLNREPNAEPLATMKVKFRLNGETTIVLNSPATTYQSEAIKIDWRGLNTKATFSPLYNKVKSTLEFAGIDVKTPEREIHLGKTTSSYQGNKSSNEIWLGERDLQCAAFSTTNDNNRTISFDKLNIHNLATGDEKNLIDISGMLDVDTLNINGGIYTQNKIDLEIKKMDQGLPAALLQQLISGKIISSPTTAFFGIMVDIMSSGSTLNFKKIETITPWGKIFSDIKMIFPNQSPHSGLLLMITGSSVSANIKAERAIALHLFEKFYQILPSRETMDPAKKAESLLTEWQQSGKIITSNEDSYLRLAFEYQNNRPLINGQLLQLTTKP